MPFHFHSSKKHASETEPGAESPVGADAAKSGLAAQPKGHNNFHIEINCPPGHVFTDLELVSGNCVLFSTHDEDVGSINVIFQGLIKTTVSTIVPDSSTQVQKEISKSEQVLFTEEKTLFQGKLLLKKNTRYSWPFEFQFPHLQYPSVNLSASNGSASIEYTLTASRPRSWQAKEQVTRRLDATNHMKGAPFQPAKLFEKIADFAGFVATVSLFVAPRRNEQRDMHLQQCVSRHNFHSSLASAMHRDEPFDPANGFSIEIQLPKSLIRGLALPVVVVANSDMANPPAATLQSISIQLHGVATIRNNSRSHHASRSDDSPLLQMPNQNLPLAFGTPIDIGAMVGCVYSAQNLPSFNSDLLSLTYNISVETVVECGDKRFKGRNEIENVQVY